MAKKKTKKKYKGYTGKEILQCNWEEFNRRIMDKNTTYDYIEEALDLEKKSVNPRETFIKRLKQRLGQLMKIQTQSLYK